LTQPRWRIRLGAEAEKDFARILKYTRKTHGSRQVDVYRDTLLEALAVLAAGRDLRGSSPRDEIRPGLRILHVAREGRRGRHFILYRAREGLLIEIVRTLHDAMDFGAARAAGSRLGVPAA
jgi:toxin ParE1/3/4